MKKIKPGYRERLLALSFVLAFTPIIASAISSNKAIQSERLTTQTSRLIPSSEIAFEQTSDKTVPLWPLYYREIGAREDTLEILWPIWSQTLNVPLQHNVKSLLWPLTRFSYWAATGDYNRYIIPVFWGKNQPETPSETSLSPNKYLFIVPLYWCWKNPTAWHLIIPPYWNYRYEDGLHRWGIFPLFWRKAGDEGTSTIFTLLWRKTKPQGITMGGLFPLIWYFNFLKFKTIVAVPAWYCNNPVFKTYGLFPLFWHNRHPSPINKTYTNILILINGFTSPNGYLWTLFPLIRFSLDRKAGESFKMIFPFWWGKNPKHVYACTFPFAWSWDREDKRMDNWSLIPLVWRFDDMNIKEPFPMHDLFSIFPIYGHNTGPEENQNWRFFVFPLFVKARKGDSRTWYFPYPLIGYKVSPENKKFWLFPLFGWGRNYEEAGITTKMSLILGFLMNSSSGPNAFHLEFIRWSLIWPPMIFYDKTPGNVEMKLTVLFRYLRTPESLSWNLLYLILNYNRTKDKRQFFALAPFIFSLNKSKAYNRQVITPLYYNRKDYVLDETGERGPLKKHTNVIFPISYYAATKDGYKKWGFLDPLSLLRDDERVRRHYSALFHLFDYKKREDDSTDFRILWRLYRRTVRGEYRTTEVFPFIQNSKAPDYRHFSIGWRLFEYERKNGEKKLRLFFLPKFSIGKAKEE